MKQTTRRVEGVGEAWEEVGESEEGWWQRKGRRSRGRKDVAKGVRKHQSRTQVARARAIGRARPETRNLDTNPITVRGLCLTALLSQKQSCSRAVVVGVNLGMVVCVIRVLGVDVTLSP